MTIDELRDDVYRRLDDLCGQTNKNYGTEADLKNIADAVIRPWIARLEPQEPDLVKLLVQDPGDQEVGATLEDLRVLRWLLVSITRYFENRRQYIEDTRGMHRFKVSGDDRSPATQKDLFLYRVLVRFPGRVVGFDVRALDFGHAEAQALELASYQGKGAQVFEVRCLDIPVSGTEN